MTTTSGPWPSGPSLPSPGETGEKDTAQIMAMPELRWASSSLGKGGRK
jgi:hypothetical protein